MARWGFGLAVMMAALYMACTPLSQASVEAPSWEPIAFGPRDADFVGAIDLRGVRHDPLFGPLVSQLARRDDLGVLLRASQIDLVASVDRGRPVTWIAVVHGVEGAPSRADVGSSVGDVVTVAGAWILGEGAAFEHVRSGTSLPLSPIAMPGRALVASTVQGRAFPHQAHDPLGATTDGLVEATVEMLGGAHLEFVLQCRYVDGKAARHAAAAARLVLLAAATRDDLASVLARSLMKVDFDVSGDLVSVRVTISDDLRDALQSYVERGVSAG
jgi:hypothetical protein